MHIHILLKHSPPAVISNDQNPRCYLLERYEQTDVDLGGRHTKSRTAEWNQVAI